MTKRNDIREAIKQDFLNYSGGHFTYTTVNIKDFDIAGLRSSAYPVINIIALNETNATDITRSIGKQDNLMTVVIEGIPWANESDAQLEIDKIIEDTKTIILSDPQLQANAIESTYQASNIFALGTDIPALTVKIEIQVLYRENRPLCNL